MTTSTWARRGAPAVAVACGLLTLAAGLATVPLDSMAHQRVPAGLHAGPFPWLFILAAIGPGVVVGTLLAARRPGNPIGWLLLVIFFQAVLPVGDYVIIDDRLHHGRLPLGGVAVAVLTSWPVWLICIAILLWVFPDGHLPAGRWRPVALTAVTAGVVLALAAAAGGAAAAAGHQVQVDATGNLVSHTTGLIALAQTAASLGVLASLLVWLAVQVPVYRRSAGERRQQFKWLYSGAAVFVLAVFFAVLTPGGNSRTDVAIGDLITPIGFAVLPVCIAVAVFRYRLYAIDRIISRVISYAVITAALAAVFAGLVVIATEVLPIRAPVAVAAATLVAAALFNPLRRRVQRAVDRRFNRARYDAEAILAAFTGRLRQTVDLGAVQGDLVTAVQQAFEPGHVSVWLAGVDH